MRGAATAVTLALLCASVMACRAADRGSAGDSAAVPDPDPAGAARARVGAIFDPLAVRLGDTVAGLVVAKFDADAAPSASCFEADSASAARLPRWEGDRRRAWFCFTNPAVARGALGGEKDSTRMLRISVADFTIHRGLSDQVNSARFVRRSDR